MQAFTAYDVFAQPNVRLCPAANDLLPDGTANINNVFHNVDPNNPNVYLITWVNVPCFGGTGGGSTFQIALINNGTDDRVEFRYGTVVNDSTSQAGTMFAGYCMGLYGNVTAPIDLSVGGSTVAEVDGLNLVWNNRPITGGTWNITTGNIPATSLLGIEVIGVADPGIDDLFFLGAPNCGLRATPDLLNAFLVTGATHAWGLPIPANPSLTGIEVFMTTAVNSSENAFGWITSNGLKGTVGTL
ncbi:MAG: hypothetical protein JNN13_01265 [Planctomycetes bacterium]|nr:hypothetical protein [Planctomycetota bacterium]